jgi:hypothetical protein
MLTFPRGTQAAMGSKPRGENKFALRPTFQGTVPVTVLRVAWEAHQNQS